MNMAIVCCARAHFLVTKFMFFSHTHPGLDLAGVIAQHLVKSPHRARVTPCFSADAEHEIVRDVKQKRWKHFVKEKIWVLSQGNIIAVGSDCFRCLEVLCQSSVNVNEASQVHDT